MHSNALEWPITTDTDLLAFGILESFLGLLEHDAMQGVNERIFLLTYKHLSEDDIVGKLAQTLAIHLAHLASGVPFPRHLLLLSLATTLERPQESVKAEQALQKLINLGYLQISAPGKLIVHQVMTGCAKRLSNENPHLQAQQNIEEAIYLVSQDEDDRLSMLFELEPHIKSLYKAATLHQTPRTYLIYWLLAEMAEVWDNSTDVITHYKEAVAALKLFNLEYTEDAAKIYYCLGATFEENNTLHLASDYYTRCFAAQKVVFGPFSSQAANTLMILGRLAFKLNDFASAENYFKQAFVILEYFDSEWLGRVECLNRLGSLAKRNGNLGYALHYYHKALDHCRIDNNNSEFSAITWGNLGLVNMQLQLFEDAAHCFTQAIKFSREYLNKLDAKIFRLRTLWEQASYRAKTNNTFWQEDFFADSPDLIHPRPIENKPYFEEIQAQDIADWFHEHYDDAEACGYVKFDQETGDYISFVITYDADEIIYSEFEEVDENILQEAVSLVNETGTIKWFKDEDLSSTSLSFDEVDQQNSSLLNL